MEFTEFSKIVFGIITAVGTIALTFFNLSQTRKVTSELLEKFELALQNKQKHAVTELFRLIHGLRMSYSDIETLVQNDECSKIIYALKKTPGLVCYVNGEFKYTEVGKNSIFQFFDKWMTRLGIYFFSFFALTSIYMMVASEGINTFVWFILVVVNSFFLGTQLRQKRYDQMIGKLVQSDKDKQ